MSLPDSIVTPFLTSESLGTRTSKGSGSIPWKLYGTAWLNFNLLVRTSFQMCRSQSWDMVWKRQPAHKIHHVISWKKKKNPGFQTFWQLFGPMWLVLTNRMSWISSRPNQEKTLKMHECSKCTNVPDMKHWSDLQQGSWATVDVTFH